MSRVYRSPTADASLLSDAALRVYRCVYRSVTRTDRACRTHENPRVSHRYTLDPARTRRSKAADVLRRRGKDGLRARMRRQHHRCVGCGAETPKGVQIAGNSRESEGGIDAGESAGSEPLWRLSGGTCRHEPGWSCLPERRRPRRRTPHVSPATASLAAEANDDEAGNGDVRNDRDDDRHHRRQRRQGCEALCRAGRRSRRQCRRQSCRRKCAGRCAGIGAVANAAMRSMVQRRVTRTRNATVIGERSEPEHERGAKRARG